MMSNLAEIVPGAETWPRFHRNRSEQFEARFVMVEVQDSPSILLSGMAGSRMPIVVSHGEGRAVFAGIDAQDNAKVALRYVDNSGAMHSHAVVDRSFAALRRHPVDVLRRILDVAGLAVHAVLRVDLQSRAPTPRARFHRHRPGSSAVRANRRRRD
jgi:hypothetical protein